MGDNRNHSTDSRNCFSYTCSASGRDNFIQKSDIVGHVWLDLGYFNWLNGIRFNPFRVEFGTFRFEHPNLVVDGQALDTHPTWTHSPSTYDYAL
ncbi:MAG: hypothetical protein H6767_04500 [Candidatus Peribacteria bacterium]|nr:MAG: hypothetical protein H6767_04500 [Candidatus Peribacteria bacterium]